MEKCVICNEREADAGANCEICIDGIRIAQRNKSGKSKYFAYINGRWRYLPDYENLKKIKRKINNNCK